MSSQLDPGQIIKLAADEANSALKVNVVAGSASFTIDSELTDNTAYTPNTSTSLVVAAEVDDVAPASVTEGNAGALRMSAQRSLHSQIRDAAGNNRGVNVTASNELNVLASAQPGIDIGDVTINNAAGASAVNVQDGGNSLTVDAIDFDIRDLNFISDSIEARQATHDNLNLNANIQVSDVDVSNGNPVPVSDAGGSLTVDGTVTVNQGTSPWVIGDGGGSITIDGAVTVSATDLDIRDLTSVSDSVSSVQSGNWSVRNQDGAGNSLTSSLVNTNRGLHSIDLGYTISEFVRNDYSLTNVTTAAYVELIASTGAEYQEFEIFDSSGETLKIAFGAAASEVDKFLVIPGGNGRIRRNVPSGTRISIRAVSATANSGEISLNLYG